MKFAVLTEPYRFEMKELSVPELKDNEILITPKKVGICGSEITAYRGIHKYRIPPVILGHEMTGAVSAIGKNVERFRVGDRVAVKPGHQLDPLRHSTERHQRRRFTMRWNLCNGLPQLDVFVSHGSRSRRNDESRPGNSEGFHVCSSGNPTVHSQNSGPGL